MSSTRSSKLTSRGVLAAIVGNILETYDFLIYSFFAIQIGHTFFQSQSAFVSLMLSLATFGVGFITRPIGALVIGAYADRAGRRPAMLLCFSLMGIAILILALTPSYSAIGIAAPVLAVFSRLLQGFSMGGEIGTNTTFLLEAAPPDKRGLIVSWQGVGQLCAIFIGSVVGMELTAVLSPVALESFGWRIAFLLGVLILPLGIWLRTKIPETLHSSASLMHGDTVQIDKPSYASRISLARSHWKVILLGFVIVGTGTIGSYVTLYIVTYAQDTLHLSAHAGFVAEMFNSLFSIPAILLGGWLSDRYGRWPVNVFGSLLYLVAILPAFSWMIHGRSEESLIVVMAILGVLGCINSGSIYASLGESLPVGIRVSGYGLIYAIGVASLGGSTQLIVTWLGRATHSAMAPAWYLVAATCVGQIALMLLPESAPVRAKRRQK